MPPCKGRFIADEVSWEALADAAITVAADPAGEWTAWDPEIAAELFGPASRQVQIKIRYRVYDHHPRRW